MGKSVFSGALFLLFFLLNFGSGVYAQNGVTITSPENNPTQQNPVEITFEFDQPVNFFGEDDVQVLNGSLKNFYIETPEFGYRTGYDFVDFIVGFGDVLGNTYQAKINSIPVAIDINSKGEIFVLTFGNGIRKFSSEGVEENFPVDGDGFDSPLDIAINSNDEIFVADNSARKIYAFSEEGIPLPGKNLGAGNSGTGKASFYGPMGLDFDLNDNLYVADYYNGSDTGVVERSRVKIYYSNGQFYEFFGRSNSDKFDTPYRLTVDNQGLLYVADIGRRNGRIQVFDVSQPRSAVYDNRSSFFEANVDSPGSIEVDNYGFIYIADFGEDINITNILNLEGAGPFEILETLNNVSGGTFDVKVFAPNFGYRDAITNNIDLPVDLALDRCGKLFINNANISGSLPYNFEFDIEIFNRLPATFTADLEIDEECESATINIPAGVANNIDCLATDAAEEFEMVWDETAPVINSCSEESVYEVESGYVLPEYFNNNEFSASDNCGGILSYEQIPSATTAITEDTTVRIIAVDEAGNESEACEIKLIITEEEFPPSFSCNVPDNLTLNLEPNCFVVPPDYSGYITNRQNFTNIDIIQKEDVIGNTMTVTLEVFDGKEFIDNCQFEVALLDITAPEINCPASKTVTFDPKIGFTIPDYRDEVAVSDNCTSEEELRQNIIQSPAPGQTISESQPIFFTLENVADCSFELTLEEEVPPLDIDCPGIQNETLDENCRFEVPDYTTEMAVEFPEAEFLQSPKPGTFISASTPVSISAVMGAQNDSCSFQLNLEDSIAPEINCPAPKTATFDPEVGFTIPDYRDDVLVSDNCTSVEELRQNLIQTPAPGEIIYATRQISFSVEAASEHSHSCSFELNLTEEQPNSPAPKCKDNQVVLDSFSDGTVTADWFYDGDPETDGVTLALNRYELTCEDLGEIDLQLTITDLTTGAFTTCTITAKVIDGQKPVMNCPANITSGFPVTEGYEVPDFSTSYPATDNCPEGLTYEQEPAPGTMIFEEGTYTITMVATDASGNSSSCKFPLTLQSLSTIDITCPEIKVKELDQDCRFEVPDYTDEVQVSNPNTVITQTPLPGTFITESTDVVMTANLNGETASCSFQLNLIDTIPPIANCVSDYTLYLNEEGNAVLSATMIDSNSKDNCGIESRSLSKTQFTTADIGEQEVTLTVRDAYGNIDDCTTIITVRPYVAPGENTPPQAQQDSYFTQINTTLNVPEEEGLLLNDSDIDDDELEVQLISNVSYGTLTLESNGSFTYIPNVDFVGQDTFLYRAFDGEDVSNNTLVTINVLANINCPVPETFALDENGEVNLSLSMPGNFDVTFNVEKDFFTCADIGTHTLKVDYSGDFNGSCFVEVTIVDDLPPQVNCVTGFDLELDEDGNATLTAEDLGIVATDNCGVDEISLSRTNFGPADIGEQEVTVTVTDSSGNVATCLTTINVTSDDFPAPGLPCVGSVTLPLNRNGEAYLLPKDVLISNGEVPENLELSRSFFTCEDLGETEITLTASYTGGDTESCAILVTITDPEAYCASVPVDPNPSEDGEYVIIYPNPGKGIVNVKTSRGINLIRAEVYDMRGRFIFKKDFYSSLNNSQIDTALDLRSYESGVYTIIYYSGEEEQYIRRAIINPD